MEHKQVAQRKKRQINADMKNFYDTIPTQRPSQVFEISLDNLTIFGDSVLLVLLLGTFRTDKFSSSQGILAGKRL